jgi:hypothetical protein
MISEQAKKFDELTKLQLTRVDTQLATELYYSKKNVRERIKMHISYDHEILQCINNAVTEITKWAKEFSGYAAKRNRLNKLLRHNSIADIIVDATVLVVNLDDRTDLITSLAGQLAPRIEGIDDQREAVITAGEILTLMCDSDLFDMELLERPYEDEESGEMFLTKSWYISNPWELPQELKKQIARAMYLPPMIVPPNLLTHNKSSGFLSIESETLLLGRDNHHEGDICLDALNRMSQIPLSINLEMLLSIKNETLISPEVMATLTADPKKMEQYKKFMGDSAEVYAHIIKHGNKYWIPYKPDKRGRTYAQAYHCNPQGNKFQKSIIELYNKEPVTGSFD